MAGSGQEALFKESIPAIVIGGPLRFCSAQIAGGSANTNINAIVYERPTFSAYLQNLAWLHLVILRSYTIRTG